MVRFYILPNADHLLEDELKFDVDLRGIEMDENARLEDFKRTLRYAFKADRKEPKQYTSGCNIAEEIVKVEPMVRILRQKLRERFDYAVISRFRHYLKRLASSEANSEEEKSTKEDCCKEIEEILRAYRQRVTYDPEQSNDETDLDLGEGARESWRNPDPKAMVQMGKEERKHTGAKPKVKEREEKRRSRSDRHSHSQRSDINSYSQKEEDDEELDVRSKHNAHKHHKYHTKRFKR